MKITSMNNTKKYSIIGKPLFQLAVMAILLIPGTAHAYVDPGSGSVIVTTILGLFAAIGYTFRKYFYKMRRLIAGITNKKSEDDSSDG